MTRRVRLEDEEVRMEMTPMIDVTFLLLIFFLCTLRFKSLEGQLSAYLPKNVGLGVERVLPIEPITVELRVANEGERRDAQDGARAWDGEGRYRFVGRRLTYRVGLTPCAGPAEAAARVRALREASPDREVKLDTDQAAIHGDVIELIDELRAAGIEDIVLRGSAR